MKTVSFFWCRLAGDAGALNTLNEELLTEQIYHDQGSHDHQRHGILDGSFKVAAACLTNSVYEGLRHFIDLGKGVHIAAGEEDLDVEVIGPLPGEGEQEHGDQHGNGQRQNDLHEGSEDTRAVDVSRFLKLVGNVLEELTEHEDVEAVLECQTCHGEDNDRPIGVQQVEGLTAQHSDNALTEHTDIKAGEGTYHNRLNGGVRNDHGKDHAEEQDLVTLEVVLRKAVSDQAAGKGLYKSGNQ